MSEIKFTRIPIAPGYAATRDGRIFSVASNWRGYGHREMAQTPNKDGYPCVRIIIDGTRKRATVHKLVASAFLPPKPSPLHEIRHLDGDETNPHASNLKWGTRAENAADRTKHGRYFRAPWQDPDFRQRAIEGMLRAHARKRADRRAA